MAETQSHPRLARFGAFEADVRTGELRKDGVKVKFGGQPFQVLAILLERPGGVVTREELQKRLWPDTFVDVGRNLNTAVNKIREVLGDSAESPHSSKRFQCADTGLLARSNRRRSFKLQSSRCVCRSLFGDGRRSPQASSLLWSLCLGL